MSFANGYMLFLCSHLQQNNTSRSDLKTLALLAQHSANVLSKWVLHCTVLSWICLLCSGVCFCHLFCVWEKGLSYNQQVIVLNLTQRIKEKALCWIVRFKLYSTVNAFKETVGDRDHIKVCLKSFGILITIN